MNFRIAHVNPDKKLIILYKIHELIQKTLVFPITRAKNILQFTFMSAVFIPKKFLPLSRIFAFMIQFFN